VQVLLSFPSLFLSFFFLFYAYIANTKGILKCYETCNIVIFFINFILLS
ncbi:hypothetical protein LINPERPRIM_LOCUS7870, partial [Linum perenne]